MKNRNRDAEAIWSEVATSADEIAEPGLEEQDQVDVSKVRQIVPRYCKSAQHFQSAGRFTKSLRYCSGTSFAISGYDSARFAYIT